MAISTQYSHVSFWKGMTIVPVCFLQTAVVLGAIKSIGVFLPQLNLQLGITSTDIGISLGLFQGFTFGFSAVPTFVYCNASSKYRRLMIVMGAVLSSGSFILGSTIANNAQLAFYLSLSGIGLSLLAVSLVMALHSKAGDYFKFFYGIGRSGYSLGMALIPLLAHYLMTVYGWRGSMMIMGGIMMHLVPLSLFVDTTVVTDHTSLDEETLEECTEESLNETPEESQVIIQERHLEESPQRNRKCIKICLSFFGNVSNAISKSILNRDHWLTVLVVTTGLYGMIGGGWHAFLIPRAVNRGFSTSRALTLAYSSGGGCFIGRCFGGVVPGTHILSSHDWFNILTVINCISLLIDIFFADFGVVIVTSFLSALCISARNVLIVLLYNERVRNTDFPTVYAVSDIIIGSSQFIGAFMSGFLTDVFHDFNASFIFLLGAEVCFFIVMIILKFTKSTSYESTI